MTTTINENIEEVKSYSPSVNIIRDADVRLNYIPTPNAKQAFVQIVNDCRSGIRSFNIVGAYGIGKSAFLWAIEKELNGATNYFSSLNGVFKNVAGYHFLHLIGEYTSFRESFARSLQLSAENITTTDIITALHKYHTAKKNAQQGLVILVDEFGKFLEYASKHNPEAELYFIQQLAEFVNDPKHNIVLVTTLHQDFNGYSRNLTTLQQNEWDKVKGRLKEIPFSEPVEQLLYLASERLPVLGIGKKDKNFHKLFRSIESAHAFPLKDYFNTGIAERLLPFDILSAATLTLSLQKYGQNERSLFSFLESNDHKGIKDLDLSADPYYNIACLYDYLIHNYYAFLSTKYNPHYGQWAAIRIAIERVEGLFGKDTSDAVKIIKTIGLLNIFASSSARIDLGFLTDYANFSLKVARPEDLVKQLENYKIIRYVRYSNKYVLFEGTDLDIELAIDEAGDLIEKVTNVVHHLGKHFEFSYIPAKASFFEKGTPRFFAFHLSEAPEIRIADGEKDGYINLIFSDTVSEKDVKNTSETCDEAIVFGFYKKPEQIRDILFEIDKIEKVKEQNPDDRVAVRELNNILQHNIKLLNHYIIDHLYSDSSVSWYFRGKKERVRSSRAFNRLLSKVCDTVYHSTPIYRNEMVNKSKISGTIATAKKSFLNHLVEKWSVADIGFDVAKFPPEKTVYLSLLRETGIHKKTNEGYVLDTPDDETFKLLWNRCQSFLEETKNGKRNLQELVDILSTRPFKLKKGFIDFWIPTFLFCKREDLALFGIDGFIPTITDGTLDLVSRSPGEYEIKAFNVEGVNLNIFNRYRALLDQSEQSKVTAKTFISTVRPFLSFYKDLPLYAKQTKKIGKKAQALRAAIAYSKNPEETFFESFPKALGFTLRQLQKSENDLALFEKQLRATIKEIRSSYEELINSFEVFIQKNVVGDILSFIQYKEKLQRRFSSVKTQLLLPHQRVFLQRVNSELDDRRAWLSSIAQACVGKPFDTISDDEVVILFEKFKHMVHELDNLCEISVGEFNENEEIVLKLEVTSFVQGLQKNLVRLPKTKNKEYVQLQSTLKARLSPDKQLNIATLAKMLEDLMSDGK